MLSWCTRTSLVPLENELGEGRRDGQISKVVQANDWNRNEMDDGLFSSCGDIYNHSFAVMTYSNEEIKGSQPLLVHPLAGLKNKNCLIQCLQIGCLRG